jgi:hypothetical protein
MLNSPCLQMLGCGQWLLIVNIIMILVFSLTFYRTFADLLVSILFHSHLPFIFSYLFIHSLCYGDEFNLFDEQRLSNLRIHDNFNCHLCREVTKACVHAGALHFGMLYLHVHFVFYKYVLFCLWNLKIWNEILSRKDGFVEA